MNASLRFALIFREGTDMASTVLRAILTDVQFWVPAVVLVIGLALLAWLI